MNLLLITIYAPRPYFAAIRGCNLLGGNASIKNNNFLFFHRLFLPSCMVFFCSPPLPESCHTLQIKTKLTNNEQKTCLKY